MNAAVRPWVVAAALAIGAVLAAAQAAQAVQAWASLGRGAAQAAVGTQVAVLLTNGQIYYGEVAAQDAAGLRLVDVYYVQTVSGQDGAPPANQLVNRARTDWHGPKWMAIPAERIVFVEGIGEKSRLSELIAQDRAQTR